MLELSSKLSINTYTHRYRWLIHKNRDVKMSKTLIHLFCFLLLLQIPAHAAHEFKTESVTELSGVPWGLAQLNKDTLIYTLRKGQAGVIDIKTGKSETLSGLPEIEVYGQGGLMDVAIPPNYKSGGWIYFTYSKLVKRKAVTTLARAVLKGAKLEQWEDLLVSDSGTSKAVHFGSRIAFDDNGHVFFGVGDRGVRDSAQNTLNHSGTIMRLKLDGAVPDDNPFVGNKKYLPEIYSFGHRNPQGLHYDIKTKKLWEVEHGPRGGDEINLIGASKNYGWPVISFGKEYWAPISVGEGTKKAGMEQPTKVYIPSIAPGSLVVYNGSAFPEWQGDLLVSALKLTHINRIELDGTDKAVAESRMLESLEERIRALLIGKDGFIYFSTDSGKVMRIVPDNQ